ncbi:C4-dicarboxylate ABC transporter, partial [Vibrio sp. 10N.222.55.C6]
IGATALFKLAAWMESVDIASQYITQVHALAVLELVVATLVVSYVVIRYLAFYRPVKTILFSMRLSMK